MLIGFSPRRERSCSRLCGIAGQDCFPIGLAAVDDDPLGPAVALERLAKEPLGGREVTPFAEPELDRVAVAVDGTVEIHPPAADLDVCLVHMPFAGDGSLATIEALQQFGRVANNPAVDGRVIDRDAPLGHHLLQVPQAEIVSQIPPDAEQDHRTIKMPALEHPVLRCCDRSHRS